MRRRLTAVNNVNYQERAKMFSVGNIASPYGTQNGVTGRVVAVYPGIGMVDLETSRGVQRYPVEELQKWSDDASNPVPPYTNSTPGGSPTVSVTASARRVALYWAGKDRKYRMRRNEEKPCCPKCGPDFPLQKTTYKRREGKSERLLGCKGCLFLIKQEDIIGGV